MLFCIVLNVFSFQIFAQNTNTAASNSEEITNQQSDDWEKSIVFTDSDSFNAADSISSSSSTSLGPGIGSFIRMILVLIIVIVLIVGLFWFLKRKTNVITNDDDYLRRVAAINLAPGKSVQVVTLIDKAYLIGVTDDSITLLGEINDDELIKAMNLTADKKANTKKPATFADVLDMFLVKTGKQQNVFSDTEKNVEEMLQNRKSGDNNL